jgi:hypothetical protein
MSRFESCSWVDTHGLYRSFGEASKCPPLPVVLLDTFGVDASKVIVYLLTRPAELQVEDKGWSVPAGELQRALGLHAGRQQEVFDYLGRLNVLRVRVEGDERFLDLNFDKMLEVLEHPDRVRAFEEVPAA